MSDDEIVCYLEDNGYPEHIVRGGRSGLIRRWSEFAAEVEQGYRYCLDEYRHDLDLRGAIATAGLDHEPEVQQADERLRALLTGTDERVWESFSGDAFWDFGYPRNASGLLLRDLRAAGFAVSKE
ncbi:MAG: hypothetical protein WB676_33025 [Bryobacteraceae bacterium]